MNDMDAMDARCGNCKITGSGCVVCKAPAPDYRKRAVAYNEEESASVMPEMGGYEDEE